MTSNQSAKGSWGTVEKGAGGGLTTSSPFSSCATPVNPSPQPSSGGATSSPTQSAGSGSSGSKK